MWIPGDPVAKIKTRESARVVGFRKAVFMEALEILPGTLNEFRRNLLSDFLFDKAPGYVLSYSEQDGGEVPAPLTVQKLEGEEVPPMPQADPEEPLEPRMAKVLKMDVKVNRAGLKKDLQRMGVFYTLSESVSYNFTLDGEAQASWDEIGKLQALSGLVVQADSGNVLRVSAQERELTRQDRRKGLKRAVLWSGALATPEGAWSAIGDSLDEVWLKLWGGYFTRPGAGAGLVDVFSLTVRGWFAPDGVKAFAKELAGWDTIIEGSALREISMHSTGISAVWTVTALDRAALDSKLAEILPGRGLEWEFSDSVAPKE